MKKVLSAILVLVFIMCSFCSITASAVSARYLYNILPSGGISLTSYVGSGTEKVLKIPETYEGHTVKELNFDELNEITYVKDIYIPKTVSKISSSAFGGSCFLENINVDANNPYFTSVDGVLYNKNMTELICYPNTKYYQTFTVPSTVKVIKEKAFELSILFEVILPEGLTTIENKAFWYSIYLEKINFPSTLRNIGENSFCSCMKLKSVTIPEGVTEIKEKAFDSCTSLERIVLPSSVQTIGVKAFMFCKSLHSVTLPSGLVAIDGGNPFLGDTNIKSLNIDSSNPYFSIVDGALYSKDMTRLYYYPYLSTERYISLPETLISIEDNAFKLNTKIIGINMPKSIRFIGEASFANTSITSIEIPKGVEQIDEMCFAYCNTLKKINIPDTLCSIGMSAFRDCKSLTDVYYAGSRSSWSKVKVDSVCNDALLSAKMHYAVMDLTAISVPFTKITMYAKDTKSIGAKVTDGLGKTSYSSSNIAVAMVSSSGKISALKKGTAKITINNNGVYKFVTVTVKNPTLNKTSLSLKKNKTYTLKITGKVGTAKFSTSNKKIATVSKSGTITAKKKGKATISVNTNGVTLKCKVTVK